MKKIIPALLLIVLASCTKQTLTAPKNANQNATATSAVSYKNSNVSVIDFKAAAGDNSILVSFITLYEKKVVKLEILKGVTANNLCSIYLQDIHSDSYSAIRYSTNDTNDKKASTLYYMIKYTLASGDWGYTPVFKLDL